MIDTHRVVSMGIDSSLTVVYGFVIPRSRYKLLLNEGTVEDEGYYVADGLYTHEIRAAGEIFVYGKILYDTEARVYCWDGNRDIVDLKKTCRLHHKQKSKINRVAASVGKKARYFITANVF